MASFERFRLASVSEVTDPALAEATASPADAGDLLQLLRDGVPRTRAAIATITGLARSTVALRIDELIQMGLVQPEADSVYTGGRPSSRIAFNPMARIVVAADLGATHAEVAVTDLRGEILELVEQPIDVADGPEPVLSWLVETSRALVSSLGRTPADVAAVGIGLPAPIEHATGRPTLPPIMPRWDGFDVPGWVGKHFAVPVIVEKDVNIMALGELSLNWPGTQNLLFVKMATGIGAGIISSGALHRGEEGIAGDIGHIHVQRGLGVPCHCGNSGCLEAIASAPALAADLRALGHPAVSGGDIVELVREGNLDAIQAVRQAGRDVGEVLAACVSMFNPAVVVVGGALSRAGEHLLAGTREVVYARSMPLATQRLQIVQSSMDAHVGIIGVSKLAIDHVLAAAAVHKRIWK